MPHPPLPRARGIIFDPYNDVLMVRNRWGFVYFPGGGFEPVTDQDLVDTVCREVAEETGVRVDPESVSPVKGALSHHHFFVGTSTTPTPLPVDPEGEVVACAWVPAGDVVALIRSSASAHAAEDERVWLLARKMRRG